MNDDLTTLASAYLDGDVTADERARVESTDELLQEVDRLRTVRAIVSSSYTADKAAISTREEHLATALGAWDRLPDNERTGALRDATPSGADSAAAAGIASMSAPSRRSSKRRRGMQSPMWLGAAAAGLVLVMAGGLVLRNVTSEDGTDSAEMTAADTSATVRESDGGAAGEAAPSAAADAAPAPELDESTAAQAAGDTVPSEFGSDVATDLSAEAPPPDDASLEQLDTVEDLAIFASDALGAPDSGDLPDGATVITDVPSEERAEAESVLEGIDLPLCQGADVVVGLAMYVDERVVVGIDESRDIAVAYRQDDCTFVARASLS